MAKDKQKKNFVGEAKIIQEELIERIKEINLDEKDSSLAREKINQIYKIRAGVNAAFFSGDRDIEITISSSKNIKEVVEVAKKLSGTMEHFLSQTAYLTKKGDTDGAIALIQEQAKFQSSILEHVGKLDEVVNEYLIKGIGRRGDVKAAQEAEYVQKVKDVKEAYASGKKLSEIAQTSEFTPEKLETLCQGLKFNYLEANREEILKALTKSKDMASVAELYEVKPKQLKGALHTWARTDEKADKVLKSFIVAQTETKPKAKPDEVVEKEEAFS